MQLQEKFRLFTEDSTQQRLNNLTRPPQEHNMMYKLNTSKTKGMCLTLRFFISFFHKKCICQQTTSYALPAQHFQHSSKNENPPEQRILIMVLINSGI